MFFTQHSHTQTAQCLTLLLMEFCTYINTQVPLLLLKTQLYISYREIHRNNAMLLCPRYSSPAHNTCSEGTWHITEGTVQPLNSHTAVTIRLNHQAVLGDRLTGQAVSCLRWFIFPGDLSHEGSSPLPPPDGQRTFPSPTWLTVWGKRAVGSGTDRQGGRSTRRRKPGSGQMASRGPSAASILGVRN